MIFIIFKFIIDRPKDKPDDIGAIGWGKVLYPRKAPTTSNKLYYLDTSKCKKVSNIKFNCELNSNDFNLENGRTLLFHVSEKHYNLY